jgi:glucokinase
MSNERPVGLNWGFCRSDLREREFLVTAESDPLLMLGIDVGGTDVKLGLVDALGTIVQTHRTSTRELGTPQRVFEYAMEFADAAIQDASLRSGRLAGVGLAVPGVLDEREFVLREVVNLPGWLDVPLLEILSTISRLPSAVVNDANSAAYAEHSLRNLGNRSLALVTLGTGIGCGLVLRGSPFGGDHGCAGELGHIAIEFGEQALPCTCGSRGHLESYAGAQGVIEQLRTALAENSSASTDPRLHAPDVTPRDIAEAAEAGDSIGLAVLGQTARYVGQAIGLMGQVLDPAVVLLGGAMTFGGSKTSAGNAFLNTVIETVRATTLVQVGGNVQIEFASLGNDAGLLGAAMVAKQQAFHQ